jgi:hypothetical protein
MFSFSSSGSTDQTEKWLKKIMDGQIFSALERYGQMGVDALAAATPVDTSQTANAWFYEIIQNGSSWSIVWGNSNMVDGAPLAVLLQHGHGTGSGGYVQGRDYINPALRPIFDQLADEAWKVVTSA